MQLGRSQGVERGRILATLVDRYKNDQPARAVEYATEALALLDRYPNPVAKAAVLNESVWAYMALGRYDAAEAMGDSARRYAASVRDTLAEARALSNLGSLAQRIGDPARAVELFTQALALQRQVGAEHEMSTSLNNMGFVYATDLADYDRSLSMHLEALAIRERLRDSAGVGFSLNNIGIVYHRLRQHDRALEYFERALAVRRALDARARVAATLHNMGDVYQDMGVYDRALTYHEEALAIRQAVGDRSAIAFSQLTIGTIHMAMGNPGEARRWMREALRIGEALGDRGLAVRNRLALSEVERRSGQAVDAQRLAAEALSIAEEMGSREMVRRASEELAKAQEARGDLQGALATLRRAKAVGDSIFTAETARRIGDLDRRYSNERRAREMERLEAEQEVLRATARVRAIQRNAVAIVAILLLSMALLLYRRRMDHARLAESLSVTDVLTGVKNRRYVEQTIEMDVAATVRRYRDSVADGSDPSGSDLVFLLLDLDHFKPINDQLGHTVGDEVLRQVATVLRSTAREADVIVRWGGEEFMVVCRFTHRDQASSAAERFRAAVEAHEIRIPGAPPISVSCSIGFAVLPLDPANPDRLTWQQVVTIADLGMLAAKGAGRNRWVGFTGGTGLPSNPSFVWQLTDVDRMVAEGRLLRVASAETEIPVVV